MGRHAGDWTAPGSPDPADRDKTAGPRHADLFLPGPHPAPRINVERAAQTFDRLVEPHRAALRAYILKLTEGDESVAESMLKETLYRVAQDPAAFPESAPAMRPLLMLTARKVVNDGERRAPAGHDDRPFWPQARSARAATPATPAATIVAAMKGLSVAHRELIVDLCYGGRSLQEAAADRGVPVETVKSQLYSAMRALRTNLQPPPA